MEVNMENEIKFERFSKFDGTNYDSWKFRIWTLLDELNLTEFVEVSYLTMIDDCEGIEEPAKSAEIAKITRKEKKCRTQIVMRIADSHLEYAKDKESAFSMWSTLQKTFERKGFASQLLLRKSLLTMKLVNGDSMEKHFLKFDKTIRNLKSAGATLEESDIVCHLLLTMPDEYQNIVTVLETLHSDEVTLAFTKNRLLEEEAKRNSKNNVKKKQEESSPVFSAFSKNRSGHNDGGHDYTRGRGGRGSWQGAKGVSSKGRGAHDTNDRAAFPFRCHQCGRVGHKKIDCKMRHSQSNSEEARLTCEDDKNISHHAFKMGSVMSNVWCLDSGASEHFIS